MDTQQPTTSQTTTDNQPQYTDDQETFNVDFDTLYTSFITSIDALRSHFNALAVNAQELNTPQYQESRCHTFYRMIGLPVVQDGSNFHSPGFDPNLNTNQNQSSVNNAIDKAIANDIDLTNQFKNREQVFKDFNKLFSNGGLNAQAIALGSIFVRSFKKQFSTTATDPLVADPSQVQNIFERITEVDDFYGPQGFTGTTTVVSGYPVLTTRHLLKPFVVDPRIDNTIRPNTNRICAPFLKDKSQTTIFQSSAGVSEKLQRPYIERVISVRFNNSNVASNQIGTNQPASNTTTTPAQNNTYVQKIINDIKANDNISDPDLISAATSILKQLYTDELVIFNNYYKIIRVVIDQLTSSIRNVQYVRQNINFDPIPSQNGGVEVGTNGGVLAAIDPLSSGVRDHNNRDGETNILIQSQKQALNNITLDTGLQGVPDPGDFAFSNLDDSVFSIQKNIQQSYADNITNLTNLRNQLGNDGINDLRNIEIIMGEFSGLGLIDMIAIQAALWIMPQNSLLGLIDTNAFDRMNTYRSSTINLNGASQNDIMASLMDFEKTLTTIYLLIQDYFDSIYDGSSSSIP
jgi:hypothetical protein